MKNDIIKDNKDYKLQFHNDLLDYLKMFDNKWKLRFFIFVMFKMERNIRENTFSIIDITFDEMKYNMNYRSGNKKEFDKTLSYFESLENFMLETKVDWKNKSAHLLLDSDYEYLIKDLDSNFMKFQFNEYIKINSLNTIKIYLYLKKFENTKNWIIKKEDFYELTNLNNDKTNNYKLKERTLDPAIKNLNEIFPSLNYQINKTTISFNWLKSNEAINTKQLKENLEFNKIKNIQRDIFQVQNIISYFNKNKDLDAYSFIIKLDNELRKVSLLGLDYEKQINENIFNDLYYEYLFPDLLKTLDKELLNENQKEAFDILEFLTPDFISILFKQKLINKMQYERMIANYNQSIKLIEPFILKNKKFIFNNEFTYEDLYLYFKIKKHDHIDNFNRSIEYLEKKIKKREFELLHNINIQKQDLEFQSTKNILNFGLFSDSKGVIYSDLDKSNPHFQYHYTQQPLYCQPQQKRRVKEINVEKLNNRWSPDNEKLMEFNNNKINDEYKNQKIYLKELFMINQNEKIKDKVINKYINKIDEPPRSPYKNLKSATELYKAFDHYGFKVNYRYDKEMEKMENMNDQSVSRYKDLVDEWVRKTYKIIDEARDDFDNYL